MTLKQLYGWLAPRFDRPECVRLGSVDGSKPYFLGIFDDREEYPVLLLDDVLSELDPRRQEFVLNHIQGGQVFITCCEEERLAALREGRVFRVKNGTIEEER